MNSLQDLEARETSARLVLVRNRLEGAAASLEWPKKIDPAANGKADAVRAAVDAYLRKLLSLPAEFPDAVRYHEKKEALKRTNAKLRMAHAHRPLPPEKMRRHRIEIPEDYDYSEALFHWANDVLGPLHDKRDAREEALEQARPAYEQVKPEIERRVQELRDEAARINVLLDGIAARKPPQPHVQHARAPEPPRTVSAETRQREMRPEPADYPEPRAFTFPIGKEPPMPFRHDRLTFDAAPEPPRTGVVPVDDHVILVGTFPR